jgi:hypothetical protein
MAQERSFPTFREASTYARELAQRLGSSVSVSRDGDRWIVDASATDEPEPDAPRVFRPHGSAFAVVLTALPLSPLLIMKMARAVNARTHSEPTTSIKGIPPALPSP